VSFMPSAEWVMFGLDQPTNQPVLKSRPTDRDEESPRSPRPSQMTSSSLSFHGTCGDSVCNAVDATMHNSNSPTLKEAMLSVATPKPCSASPNELGCCNASDDVATHDVELTVATPKAGLPTQYIFEGVTTLDESPSSKCSFSLCPTPKAGSSSLPASFGFFEELPAEDCTTPKVGSSSLPASFGFFEELPAEDCTTPKARSSSSAQLSFSIASLADFGDGSQSDSDTADTPLHNECQAFWLPQEHSPSTATGSCQNGDPSPSAASSNCHSGNITLPTDGFPECVAVKAW